MKKRWFNFLLSLNDFYFFDSLYNRPILEITSVVIKYLPSFLIENFEEAYINHLILQKKRLKPLKKRKKKKK